MKYDAIFKGMIVCVRHKNIQLSTTYMRTVGSVRCMDTFIEKIEIDSTKPNEYIWRLTQFLLLEGKIENVKLL